MTLTRPSTIPSTERREMTGEDVNPSTGEPGPEATASVSTAELLEAIAVKDHAAFSELYQRLGTQAYRLSLRILRDEQLAEDAVQDAFLSVWRGAASYRASRGSARSWLFSLVHHRAVDIVRRNSRQPLSADEGATETPALDNVEGAVEDNLLRLQLQKAIGDLPEREGQALTLAYYGGYTQSEIAAHLGEPLGTVKSRMFTGLKRLRPLLQEGT